MKSLLTKLLLLSLGCTCLISSGFASFLGTESPCHHLAENVEQNQEQNQGQKGHCCEEKQAAWKEVVELEEETFADEGNKAALASYVLGSYENNAPITQKVKIRHVNVPSRPAGWAYICLRL